MKSLEIALLAVGYGLSLLVPLRNGSDAKSTLYFAVMALFVVFVFAFAILSITKFATTKAEYVKERKILSWNLPDAPRKKRSDWVPWMLSLLFGAALFGILWGVENVALPDAAILGFSLSCIILSFWLIAIDKTRKCLADTDDFLLSHVGIILLGTVTHFDGVKKGIVSVEKKDQLLAVTIRQHKKDTTLFFPIPPEKEKDVDAFLKDLNDYLNGEAHE